MVRAGTLLGKNTRTAYLKLKILFPWILVGPGVDEGESLVLKERHIKGDALHILSEIPDYAEDDRFAYIEAGLGKFQFEMKVVAGFRWHHPDGNRSGADILRACRLEGDRNGRDLK